MNTAFHIWISRSLAFALFAMVLVLTPRAWVEAKPVDAVPVQTLEPAGNEYCFWCDHPAPSSTCPKLDNTQNPTRDTNSKTTLKQNSTRRMWLNPDAPIRPIDLRPCPSLEEDSNKTSNNTGKDLLL